MTGKRSSSAGREPKSLPALDAALPIIGGQIRAGRRAKRLTQDQLAQRVQLDRTYIGAIERGTANPSIRVLWAIAEVIAVPIHELLKVEAPPESRRRKT